MIALEGAGTAAATAMALILATILPLALVYRVLKRHQAALL